MSVAGDLIDEVVDRSAILVHVTSGLAAALVVVAADILAVVVVIRT